MLPDFRNSRYFWRLPEFPPLYKPSLHPHTKPITTVLWKYTNRTCGVFVVADTKATPHLPSAETWYKPWRHVPFVGFGLLDHFLGPPTCLLSVRTYLWRVTVCTCQAWSPRYKLRFAHVRPGHQDTSYGLHMSGLVTKTQATALMEHSLLHLTFLASRLNGHSESKAFRAEGQTQDFEKSNEQRSTVPRAMFI